MTDELQALQDVDFGWVESLDSVWSDEGATDAGPNQQFADAIIADLKKLTKTPSPPCRALVGQAGIGKTHLVGVLRRQAWANGCWFVLLDVVGITDFWKSAALSFLTSLLQEMPDGQRQYEAVIGGVARQFKIEKEVKIAFESATIEPKRIVDLLVGGLIKKDPSNALKYQDVFRAISLLRSHDLATVGIAHAWLQGYDADESLRKNLGFLTPPPAAVEIVRGLSWVMGLAGPTLIAVDQIDGVLAVGGASVGSDFGDGATFASLLTSGLLDLTTVIGRGMIVLTTLLSSWETIKTSSPMSLLQRFTAPVPLRPMQGEAMVRTLIASRLVPAYAKSGVVPLHPTGPFSDAAIRSVSSGETPRTLLMRCDEHRKKCLAEGKVTICDDLGSGSIGPVITPPSYPLDSELAKLSKTIDLSGFLDDKDDGNLGMLLRNAFDLYAKQIPVHEDYDVVCKADPAQKTPPLHGRLSFIDHRNNDSEKHYCFRALQHSSAVALCARFKAALTASGIGAKLKDRSLIIVRRGPQPSGAKTKELFDFFRSARGIEIDPSDDDLRTFASLQTMRDAALADSRFDAFERWLINRQPLCETAFFKAAGLCPPPIPGETPKQGVVPPVEVAPPETLVVRDGLRPPHQEGTEEAAPDVAVMPTPVPVEAPPAATPPTYVPPPASSDSIPIGHRIVGDQPVNLSTEMLPKHTAIIAGSGSGKTVLLRRIVEEAALAGIPAIVIDPNNDLSRLGDAWPERPVGFDDADAAKAERYAAAVEVVIWTPGIYAGNPLFLSVLPDFAALGDDRDERAQAVTMAADTLGPLADAKTNLKKGVLSDALRAFAIKGGSLQDMIAFLEELPDGVSGIGNADKIAAKMADELKASIATNPLLKATGPVLDPKLLFFGHDATRTRVSVINLSGLPSNDAKQDFVNRLQMTLFSWIKKHFSPEAPHKEMLYVIDEAQTFIPSVSGALSKTSGVQLVSQARKYGLGMIVATQAPKGIDNNVVSNCTTQFLGKQNAPATIGAAQDLIAASGGRADDLGKLRTGEFYFKTGDGGKPVKLRTPLCLSYHPANPPTPEEVVARAKASAIHV